MIFRMHMMHISAHSEGQVPKGDSSFKQPYRLKICKSVLSHLNSSLFFKTFISLYFSNSLFFVTYGQLYKGLAIRSLAHNL